jgi:hypothetical protein
VLSWVCFFCQLHFNINQYTTQSRRCSNPNAIDQLVEVRDEMLGKEEELSLEAPTLVDGEYKGGTAFERLGQEGVKGTRCYSLSLTHQSPRCIVSPTAGGKVYEGDSTENERMRNHAVKVS